MKSTKYLLCIMLFSAFVGRAQDNPTMVDDNKVVARVDSNFSVSLKDLRQYITDWKYQIRFRDKSDIYRNALRELIANRLRVSDFFERRLDENQELMSKIRRIVNHELINSFFDGFHVLFYFDFNFWMHQCLFCFHVSHFVSMYSSVSRDPNNIDLHILGI